MTTYHTFDTGLPAPSNFDPVHRLRQTPVERAALFNRFCTQRGITHNRPQFSTFVSRKIPGELTWTGLWVAAWKHDALIQAEDARDLANTQQDALI